MSLNLITDRTQGDCAHAAAHRDSTQPLKGAYNAADYNRVGEALNYLSDWLHSLGYGFRPRLRTDWLTTDNMRHEDAVSYLETVRQLKESFFSLPETPPLPERIEALFAPGGHSAANAIEQVLLDIERVIEYMIASLHYANQFYAGEDIDISGFRFARRQTVGELEQYTVAYLEGFTINEIEFGGV